MTLSSPNNTNDRAKQSQVRNRNKSHTKKSTGILAVLVVTLVTLTWAENYQSPLSRGGAGDSFVYLTSLLKFSENLPDELLRDPAGLIEGLSHAGRPPLYQLIALPFVELLGASESAALSVNSLFYLLLLFSVYRAGTLVGGQKVGLLSAFLAGTYPPVVNLSHAFLPVFALVACSALSLWFLLALVRTPTIGSAWAFAFSVAFGLLIHPQFIWMAATPCLLSILSCLPAKTEEQLHLPKVPTNPRRLFFLGLLPSAILAGSIVLGWYLTLGQQLIETSQKISASNDMRGSALITAGFSHIEPSALWYAQTAPYAISNLLMLFFVVGLFFVVFGRRLDRWILVLSAAGCFVLLSLQTTYAWMYMAQALPVVAIISTFWIEMIRPRWISTALILACLSVGSINFLVSNYGLSNWMRPIATSLMICPAKGYFKTCGPPSSSVYSAIPTDFDPQIEVLKEVFGNPSCRDGKPCTLMHLHYGPCRRFEMRRMQNWPRERLRIASTSSNLWGGPFNFPAFLSSEYILYPTEPAYRSPERPLYQHAAARFLHSPPAAFLQAYERIRSFESPGLKLDLLKRVKPLSSEAVEIILSAFPLASQMKSSGYEFLAGLYREEGSHERVISLCEGDSEIELSKTTCIRSRIALAKAMETRGDANAAIAVLREGADETPDSAQLHRLLGGIYRRSGALDEAISSYRNALQIDGSDTAARVQLAGIYLQLKQPTKAIAELKIAISLEPKSGQPLRKLAEVHRSSGNIGNARIYLEKALRLDPEDLHARRALERIQGERGNSTEATESQ